MQAVVDAQLFQTPELDNPFATIEGARYVSRTVEEII
ncbi:hypothetical protein [Aerococcus urinaehominis]